ncbi:Hsp20/alpha crystallin family protein [Pseudoroseomonas cervicalis]|uniref:Hsp20/alpha crystallin family protein n=2 Tax=Teichococcus cervicalis TaxID=204525 RepID=D5RQ85_9PROT|nr:Hsp20/alpha crystallin family protein [Pseudoroseomonas cervicalis ATCC 49957]
MPLPMTVYPADPFALLRRVSDALDRVAFAGPAPAFPAVNVWQNDEAAAIVAELPGVGPQDIEITVKEDVLTISGERRAPELPEHAEWLRRERAYGRFSRAIRLPFRVDPDQVDARFTDGVLRIAVRRPEADRPQRIAIKAG